MRNNFITLKNLKKMTYEFVKKYFHDPVVSVPVHIVDRVDYTYDEEDGDILPYKAYNKYIVKRNENGSIIHQQYCGCRRVDIYLDGIANMARKENKDPEVVLHEVLGHMTMRLMDGIDPTWRGGENILLKER